MSDLSDIVNFFCSVEESIFLVLDGVYIDSYTFLDILVALMVMGVVIDFIVELRSYKND